MLVVLVYHIIEILWPWRGDWIKTEIGQVWSVSGGWLMGG